MNSRSLVINYSTIDLFNPCSYPAIPADAINPFFVAHGDSRSGDAAKVFTEDLGALPGSIPAKIDRNIPGEILLSPLFQYLDGIALEIPADRLYHHFRIDYGLQLSKLRDLFHVSLPGQKGFLHPTDKIGSAQNEAADDILYSSCSIADSCAVDLA